MTGEEYLKKKESLCDPVSLEAVQGESRLPQIAWKALVDVSIIASVLASYLSRHLEGSEPQ